MTVAIAGERLVVFTERLISCLNYCYLRDSRPPSQDDYSVLYRSASLKPAAKLAFPDSCHTKPSHDMFVRFNEFIAARVNNTLPSPDAASLVQAELHRPMALLVTDSAKSLFDGAVTPESQGFFDEDCIPPWDCWVDLIEVETSYGGWCLISWIPRSLSDRVDFSLAVDAAECMSWLRSVDDKLEILGWGHRWHQS